MLTKKAGNAHTNRNSVEYSDAGTMPDSCVLADFDWWFGRHGSQKKLHQRIHNPLFICQLD